MLARALTQHRNDAPILIDTAGAIPHETAETQQLKEFAAAAEAEMAIVLPAGLDPAESADLAMGYAACGALHLIVTRLDVTRRLGGILSATAASRLPLTEAGIGPGAADGLVSFTPSLLAARLIRSEGANDAN